MNVELQKMLQDILKGWGVLDIVPNVSISENISHGEYTTNVAMKLAKSLKMSPMDIASRIVGEIKHNSIDKVETVAPGFINIFLKDALLSSSMRVLLSAEFPYRTVHVSQSKRITIEFTDPNPFKEFHLGHLYSNSVGESLARLFESQRNVVRRVNYQGDVGMHVAKAMYGLLKNPSLFEAPDAKKLGEAYTFGAKAFEENEGAKAEIVSINTKIYDKDPEIYALYEKARQLSLDYFESIYARLGTKFEGYYFESIVGVRGLSTVKEHIVDGVFEESDGAIVYKGEKHGLHTRVFVNKLGLPTYEAKELGLAPTKYDDWPYDESYIVTGNEINEYFKVLLSALGEISPQLAAKTRHIGHGMVRKADGSKMSSREGLVLSGDGLLDEVKMSIYTIIDTSIQKYTNSQREEIAEIAAVAAVKYSLLRVSLPSDVAFDPVKSVSFDGDSGPYLLYTYARAKSVLKKEGTRDRQRGSEKMNAEEKALARLLFFFPEIVEKAAADLSPNILCTYLFDIAQQFNGFYQKHPILDDEQRLVLTEAVSIVLKNGLYLLGIKTVERM